MQTLGARAVGMSTVPETILARWLGLRVLALSLVTNLAAGIGNQPLAHDEVVAAGKQAAAALTTLVTEFCRQLRS